MKTKSHTIVVALGGNALGSTPAEQLDLITRTAATVVDLLESGAQVVVTHGNGPQVGMIKVATDIAHREAGTPAISFPECGAMSQGYIGYQLQQAIDNDLRSRGLDRQCLSLVTQTEVDADDPAFSRPTKPVGAFLSQEQAEAEAGQTGRIFVEDAGRGWRWVVASPRPARIVEAAVITDLVSRGVIVIASGGGGVPVVTRDERLVGVPAVIDKDRSAALLARQVGADTLLVLTATDAAYRGYGTPEQQAIRHMDADTCRAEIEAGTFAEGSMRPKVQACLDFVTAVDGGTAIISSLQRAREALNGTVGTRITAS